MNFVSGCTKIVSKRIAIIPSMKKTTNVMISAVEAVEKSESGNGRILAIEGQMSRYQNVFS